MDFIFVKESTYMHRPMDSHPENPRRVLRIKTSLVGHGVSVALDTLESTNQSESLRVAKRIHSPEYVDYLFKLSREAPVSLDEDTYLDKDSLRLALGSLYLAYRYAFDMRSVFLITRPPGHHAGANGRALGASTQGFCLLNNAAGAVYGFMDAGLRKIATLDFDAHHGNGTMELFMNKRILQIDIHQDPNTLYPHTGYPDEIGIGEGYGFKANFVLPPGAGDDIFEEVLDRVRSILNKYSPDAIVVSAGFDGFENDGLADLDLTEISYYGLGSLIKDLGIPAVIVLEGGYSIGLERGAVAFAKGLIKSSEQYPSLTSTPRSLYRRAIESINRVFEKISSRVS